MTIKTRLIQQAGATPLKKLVAAHELEVDCRSPAQMRKAIRGRKDIPAQAIAAVMRVPELRATCEALDLDSSGGRKVLLGRLFKRAAASVAQPRALGAQKKSPVTIALVDTETTGLGAKKHRIMEVAALLVRADRATGVIEQELDRYESLHDPGIPIPREATLITGLTDSDVRGKRIDAKRLNTLLSKADLVVAHCSGFDKGFVAQVLPSVVNYRWACACKGIPWKKFFPHVPTTRLQDLRKAFRIPAGTAHRAMGDVLTTREILGIPLPKQKRTPLAYLIEHYLD